MTEHGLALCRMCDSPKRINAWCAACYRRNEGYRQRADEINQEIIEELAADWLKALDGAS